ncbi:hypothetical protein ACQ4M3_09845 [Leptolyngbya sp. AN03gr2]|uniref:hypothetical protein n=1 Tax=Leptolyngbya sp. AN03gr2 TaxID=3423364 RepID=UPI003D31678D
MSPRTRTEAYKILLNAGWTVEEIESVLPVPGFTVPRPLQPWNQPPTLYGGLTVQQYKEQEAMGVFRRQAEARAALEALKKREGEDLQAWADGIASDVCEATD